MLHMLATKAMQQAAPAPAKAAPAPCLTDQELSVLSDCINKVNAITGPSNMGAMKEAHETVA